MATGLDFTETRFVPAFRELIQDPAVVEEFDRLSAFLRSALAGLAQPVVEVNLEDGPPQFFDGDGALTTTQPAAAIAASDGVTPIANTNISHHYRYINQVIQRYHTVFQGGVSDPGGDVSSGGGGSIKFKSKTVSHDAIKTLNSSPVEIIAAPGADKALVVIQTWVTLNFPTTAYSANQNSSLIYASTVSAADFTLRLASTGRRLYAGARSNLDITTITQVENDALQLWAAADVTGGDSDNSLRVDVLYRTVTLL